MRSLLVFVCGLATVCLVTSELIWLQDMTMDHARRNMEGGLPSNLRFNLTRGLKQLELNLQENRRLNPNAPVFKVKKNPKTGLNELKKQKSRPLKNAKFYHDKQNGGAFSISCENKDNGPCSRLMTGSMHLEGRNYEIRPAPSMLTARGLGQASRGVAHEFTEIKVKPSFMEENKDYQEKDEEYELDILKEELKAFLGENKLQKMAEKMKERKRRATGPYALEIVVAADPAVWDAFYARTSASNGMSRTEATEYTLRQHYVHIINGISLRYEEITDPNMDIYVTVTGFLFYQQVDETNPLPPSVTIDYVDGKGHTDASGYLDHIRTWVAGLDGLPHNDHIMVFTGYELYSGSVSNTGVAGMAPVSGVCTYRRYSIQEDDGTGFFTIVSVAAHELGHNLGSSHDGSGSSAGCAAGDSNIMAPSVTSFSKGVAYSINPWRFSSCSVNAFKTYVNALQDNCLLDHGDYYNDNEYQTHTSQLPGEMHTPDEQCKLVRGDNSYLCGEASDENICRFMLCKGDDGYCWYYAAAMGTPCGQSADNKWCFEGQCVARSDIFSGNTGGGASVGSGNTGTSGTGSSTYGGNEATTTTTTAPPTAPPSTGTCSDDGWSGWTCPELSDYFLANYGATPAQWCQDPTWTPRCCQTCAAANGPTTTTTTTMTTAAPAPATGSCVDIGWSGYSCEAVEGMFFDQQGIWPSYWCRDPSWKAICCSLCAANGI